MKRFIFAIVPAITLFYGCASTKVDLAERSPVAIMTIYSNPSVPWYDERTGGESVEDGILSGAVNRLVNKANPEYEERQERINQAGEYFSLRLRNAGLEVIDPTTAKDNPAYKNAGKTFVDYVANTLPAEGYEAITGTNRKKNKLVCKETGAKSVLYVKFHFQKVYAKEGVHEKGVAARLVMSVFGTDENGKKIINKEYKAVSEEYAELVNYSNWDRDQVLSFFPELESIVIGQFLSDFVFGGEAQAQDDFAATPIKIKPKEKTEAKTEEKPAGDTESAVLAEKKATAKKLLERGMSKEEVSENTGLSIEQIEE